MQTRLLILAFGTFVIGTDGFMIAGLLPAIAQEMGVSVAEAGYLVTAFALLYAIASPFMSAATASVSRKTLILSAITFFGAANLLAWWAPSYGWLLLSRCAAALGAALYTPNASAAAAAMATPENRGRALAVVTGGMTVAMVIGVPIGSWIGTAWDWRTCFLLVGLASAAAAGLLAAMLPALPESAAAGWAERAELIRRPDVRRKLLPLLLWITGGFALYTYLPAVVSELLPRSAVPFSIFLFLYGLACIGGNAYGGYAADRLGAESTIRGGLIALTLALGSSSMLHLLPDLWGMILLITALAAWGFSGWSLNPAQQLRLLSAAPQHAGLLLSLNGSVLYIGVAAGSLIGGLVLRFGGAVTLGATSALFPLIALSLLIVENKAQRRNVASRSSNAA